jgi:ribosomal protein L24E
MRFFYNTERTIHIMMDGKIFYLTKRKRKEAATEYFESEKCESICE